jgi:hypothetical protein
VSYTVIKLLTAPAGPLNEPGLPQDGHMLLHSGRAHRIQASQRRHRQRPAHGTADDVAPGAVGQRPEDEITLTADPFVTIDGHARAYGTVDDVDPELPQGNDRRQDPPSG